MDFTLATDDRAHFVVILFVVIILLNLVIFSFIAFFRIALSLRGKRERKFLEKWRPIITQSAFQKDVKLPAMDKKYIMLFISEWNALYDKLGGDCHDNLVFLAIRLRIHQYAVGLLITGQKSNQLAGITTLGNIRSDNAWNPLVAIAHTDNTVVSLAAFNACSKINPERVFTELFHLCIERKDWPTVLVARVLKNLNSLQVCQSLYKQVSECKENSLNNVLTLFGANKCIDTYNPIKIALEKSNDPSVIALCLKALNDPRGVNIVVSYAHHDDSYVRMQAAVSLGRIGGKDEVPLLINLMCDEDWWVRYRAAQTLVHLPFLDKTEFLSIKENLNNPNGIQMLNQVLLETKVQQSLNEA